MRPFLASLVLALAGTAATATDNCAADAMIVFDGSGSMAEMGFNNISEPRIFEARRAMATALPAIALRRKLGLIIYGPNGPDECTGIDLRFPPLPDAAPAVREAVDALQPGGSTPLTEAVQLAAETLDHENRPATIVLVTDGNETCGGAPCTLATHLAVSGLDTTVHVIGFKVRSSFFTWNPDDDAGSESLARCLADETGGTYTNAETVDELIAALRDTLGCQLLY